MSDNDLIREQALKDAGFTVIRFRDDEILNDMANVTRTIVQFIEEFQEKNHGI